MIFKINLPRKDNGNRLIAEFMGLDVLYDNMVKHETAEPNMVTLMKYHTSWDWLMPVVEKIEVLGHGVTIYRKGCQINDVFCTVKGFNHLSKIGETYKAIIKFITWYNEQNK